MWRIKLHRAREERGKDATLAAALKLLAELEFL
jgi:hypothetical protein